MSKRAKQSTKQHLRHIAEGGTINGTYRTLPEAALRLFRADLGKLLDALERIGAEEHEPDCKFKFCPLPECPTCKSAATIAKEALK